MCLLEILKAGASDVEREKPPGSVRYHPLSIRPSPVMLKKTGTHTSLLHFFVCGNVFFFFSLTSVSMYIGYHIFLVTHSIKKQKKMYLIHILIVSLRH